MTTISVDVFLNPVAGRGRAARRLPGIESQLASHGIQAAVHRSRDVGDLEAQVRRFLQNGGQRPVIVGGDGSIHEAVNGIMAADASTAFGVIPCGTGNDFAKACEIPRDWQEATAGLAARLAENRPLRTIDVGVMNQRYFANGAGIGFDAKVTGIARAYRWPIGDFVYLFAIFRAMRDGIATPAFHIDADGEVRDGPVTLASVANGAWIGGMFHIAPPASNADGLLNLVVAAPVTRTRILALLPMLMRGRHLDETEVTHTPVRKLRIESVEPVPCHLDGEMQPLQTAFDISVLPGALTVL
jgi:diacylglycerol kinase (ATP)